MPYQGRQPGVGVRNRFIFIATSGQTSFSGADSNGLTLKYPDATYTDVFLNGVLLIPVTDYAATNNTSVVLSSGAGTSDVVEIVAYDISSIANTVPVSGGTFTGPVTVGGTLDVSGNLLVGRTADSNTTVGVSLRPDGQVSSSRDGNVSFVLNRNTSDGSIALFTKDGSTVGSVGSSNSDLMLGNSDVGLKFHDANDKIYPWNVGTDAIRDGGISLGDTGGRFKDLYLSGGVYLGGTGSANKLDDYEEGTWTPTIAFGGASAGVTYLSNTGRYTKIGNSVTIWWGTALSAKGSSTGTLTITGLPFLPDIPGGYMAPNGVVKFNNCTSISGSMMAQVSSSNFLLIQDNSATATEVVTNANLSNSSWVLGSVTYKV